MVWLPVGDTTIISHDQNVYIQVYTFSHVLMIHSLSVGLVILCAICVITCSTGDSKVSTSLQMLQRLFVHSCMNTFMHPRIHMRFLKFFGVAVPHIP